MDQEEALIEKQSLSTSNRSLGIFKKLGLSFAARRAGQGGSRVLKVMAICEKSVVYEGRR